MTIAGDNHSDAIVVRELEKRFGAFRAGDAPAPWFQEPPDPRASAGLAPAPRPRLRAAPPAPDPLSRRADLWRRSDYPPSLLGVHPATGRRGDHRLRHTQLHGRGAPLGR